MSRGRGRRGLSKRATNPERDSVTPLIVPKDPERRKPGRRGVRPIFEGATVKSRCWCGGRTVEIPIEYVSQGRTETCGRDGCEER